MELHYTEMMAVLAAFWFFNMIVAALPPEDKFTSEWTKFGIRLAHLMSANIDKLPGVGEKLKNLHQK